MNTLNQVMNSEYMNPGDLVGLESVPELMGFLNSLEGVEKAKAINKIIKRPIPSHGSRAEFEKFFSELPKHIKDQLLQGKLRLADHTIYSIKPIKGAKTIKIFESQDVKEVGLRNISNAKLPKNMALLVSGIYFLQGIAASLDNEDVKKVTFDSIENIGPLVNGEFKLKANKVQLVSDISNRKFNTNGFSLVPKGFFKLSNPRLIQDDVEIEFEIELGTIGGLDPNAVLFVGLEGTATIP